MNVAALKRSPGGSASFNLRRELPPLEYLGEKISFAGPVDASFTVSNSGQALAVTGEAKGELQLACGRCLEPFTFSFAVPVEESYAIATDGAPAGAAAVAGDTLDVTPDVYRSIIMALPMKALCREDCPGLCPACGRRLEEGPCNCGKDDTDPRLAALKKLLS